jgi:hypothetical protein
MEHVSDETGVSPQSDPTSIVLEIKEITALPLSSVASYNGCAGN